MCVYMWVYGVHEWPISVPRSLLGAVGHFTPRGMTVHPLNMLLGLVCEYACRYVQFYGFFKNHYGPPIRQLGAHHYADLEARGPPSTPPPLHEEAAKRDDGPPNRDSSRKDRIPLPLSLFVRKIKASTEKGQKENEEGE